MNTLFDAATLPAKIPPGTDPYLKAVARRTDPATSHQAANTIGPLRPKQAAVLHVVHQLTTRMGGGTDEQIADWYHADVPFDYVLPEQSPSGLRTRRCELVRAGKVVDTGERRPNRQGRLCCVWATV